MYAYLGCMVWVMCYMLNVTTPCVLSTTDVHTGKRTPNESYCINSKVAIGMKIFKEVFIEKL